MMHQINRQSDATPIMEAPVGIANSAPWLPASRSTNNCGPPRPFSEAGDDPVSGQVETPYN
jgi:hypothetical protein